MKLQRERRSAQHLHRVDLLNLGVINDGQKVAVIPAAGRRRLLSYRWPGNVRELAHEIERAVVLCDGPTIEPRHLPAAIVPEPLVQGPPPIPGSTIAELERHAILKTLEACGGSTSKAAAILGISEDTLQNWEQGRCQPDRPAQAYLRAIAAEPRDVAAAQESELA